MNKTYAGIGSRKTPPEMCQVFANLAGRLGQAGWTLRSGRAEGADSAFEAGARAVRGSCEIYLPEDLSPLSQRVNDDLREARYLDEVTGSVLGCKIIARLLHPYGNHLRPESLELHARNTYQIIGRDMNSPVQFVVCWTEGGLGKGGTGQALRLAKMLNIHIIDYGSTTEPMKWWSMNDYICSVYGV